tara:strand:- start:11 stop:370 length:360 start_codon:yes stop_codon:yes gene_type:complete
MEHENSITITEPAAEKVHNLKLQQNNNQLLLRISITGGGCHGFQYKFAFEDEARSDDFAFSKNLKETNQPPITIVVDPISMGYLRGSEVDYLQDAKGERFIIRNPNASTTCGCDRSFTT